MLRVITVDGVLGSTRESVGTELKSQLPKEKVLHYYGDRMAYWQWSKEKVLLLAPEHNADAKAHTILLDFITKMAMESSDIRDAWNNGLQDMQLWIIGKLNEGISRKIRKLEAEYKFVYMCFLLHKPEPLTKMEKEEAYPEAKRITKTTQNGRVDATWLTWSEYDEGNARAVSLLLNRKYGVFHSEGYELSRLTSANSQPNVETPLSYLMRQYYSDIKQRQINWYPKKYVQKAMDEEKWGVEKLPMKEQGRVKRHVLVTGTGRSGTTYFSDLLTQLGLDVGHQRNGDDGCSGAEFAIDNDWYPWFPVYGGGDCANVGERRSDYTYKHVLHIVRHPLWCIPSLMKNYPAINPEFWADSGVMDPSVMTKSSLIRNATMYYNINRIIDESHQAEYRCQLEQVHDHWNDLMAVLEMTGTPDPVLKASNQATGWGQYEPLTWQQLEDGVGHTLANSIQQQAKEYGYE
jgi:hypothetical protein